MAVRQYVNMLESSVVVQELEIVTNLALYGLLKLKSIHTPEVEAFTTQNQPSKPKGQRTEKDGHSATKTEVKLVGTNIG